MHICVYAYMYACVHVCMHACVYVYMCACMYVCVYVYMYACMCVCFCAFILCSQYIFYESIADEDDADTPTPDIVHRVCFTA